MNKLSVDFNGESIEIYDYATRCRIDEGVLCYDFGGYVIKREIDKETRIGDNIIVVTELVGGWVRILLEDNKSDRWPMTHLNASIPVDYFRYEQAVELVTMYQEEIVLHFLL